MVTLQLPMSSSRFPRLPLTPRKLPRPLHGHGRRVLPEDTPPRRRARLTPRARATARDECIREYGFDPRVERSPAAPRVRADCQGHEGRCGACSCRHHLALDVRPTSAKGHPSSIRMPFKSEDPADWPDEVCALDIAETYDYPDGGEGVMIFSEIGRRMRLTKERARQIYASAALKFLKGLDAAGLDPILVLEWLEGCKRRPPTEPSPLRRAQVLGVPRKRVCGAPEAEEPRVSPAARQQRHDVLQRRAVAQRIAALREARRRGAASMAAPAPARRPAPAPAQSLAPFRRVPGVMFL